VPCENQPEKNISWFEFRIQNISHTEKDFKLGTKHFAKDKVEKLLQNYQSKILNPHG